MSSFVFYKFKSQKEPSRISFDGIGISVWDLKKDIIMENKMGKGADFDFAIYNADTEEGSFHFHFPPLISICAMAMGSYKLAETCGQETRCACLIDSVRAVAYRSMNAVRSSNSKLTLSLSIAEYTDDHTVVPRSTSVLAQRLPPKKAGKGNAQFYMAAALGSISATSGPPGSQGGASGSGWRDKGSMSKRFDGRDDRSTTTMRSFVQVSSLKPWVSFFRSFNNLSLAFSLISRLSHPRLCIVICYSSEINCIDE